MSNQDTSKQRPQRRDFMKTVVIGANAQIVDPKDWQKVTRGAEGRDFRKILKENHWTSTRVFDSEGYEKAVKSFRDHSRSKTQETRKTLFQQAFEEAGVSPHPRIESALRTVLPLMDPENNEERVVRALGRIVSSVDSVMVEDKRNPKKGQRDKAKESKDEEPEETIELADDGEKQAKSSEADAKREDEKEDQSDLVRESEHASA